MPPHIPGRSPLSELYTTLVNPASQVRLLKLQNSRTEYDLGVFSLDASCPPFTAVSYTWGDSRIEASLRINGRPFLIRQAAWDLLKDLPSLDMDCHPRPEYVWIDSICINQSDLIERNHQVRLMRKIYSSAKVVLVWLGGSTSTSDLAMSSLAALTHQRLGKPHKKSSTVPPSSRVLYGQMPGRAGYSYQGDPEVLRLALDARIGDAILSLFSRVYWRRVWIIQEVLLAKDIRIVCGSKCINWNKLNSFFGGLEFSMFQSGSQFHGSSRISSIMKAPGYILVKEKAFLETNPLLKEQGASISDLLLSFGDFECRDKHDKVYGMLGISSDNIDVNYAKSIQHVYNDVLRHIVRRGQMETIYKAEYFSRRLASVLGIRLGDKQLIRTESLFLCSPRLLTWADERPFWENDLARAFPKAYYNHVRNILALSMTSMRPRHQASERTNPTIADGTQESRRPPVVGDAGSEENLTAGLQSLQTAEDSSLSTLHSEFENESLIVSLDYGDFQSYQDEDLEPPSVITDADVQCKDDIEIPITADHHVDYLSFDWNEEGLWRTWRALQLQSRPNMARLKNVLWRVWAQSKDNLARLPPEELNWLKECDVTWLYGPFLPASHAMKHDHFDSQTARKGILRRRRPFETESLSTDKSRARRQVHIQEDVQVIGYDGGLGSYDTPGVRVYERGLLGPSTLGMRRPADGMFVFGDDSDDDMVIGVYEREHAEHSEGSAESVHHDGIIVNTSFPVATKFIDQDFISNSADRKALEIIKV
ncbi:HET-domain-containing [Fusarium albosuccineum]|uniref:HET-domain-containing n=1 Tax=Fusarium albosuccineum TaxID=1237068 RepID=A0A8H4KVW5_9HYPO|nr:HET-domain-containing [Fusarium albosuccineum]